MALNQLRREAVDKAWRTLDPDMTGLVPLDVLLRAYDPSRHPKVCAGIMAPSRAVDILRNHMDASQKAHSGNVLADDFILFHAKMSAEIDKERMLDADRYFAQLDSRTQRDRMCLYRWSWQRLLYDALPR